jgi:hypothetical protein
VGILRTANHPRDNCTRKRPLLTFILCVKIAISHFGVDYLPSVSIAQATSLLLTSDAAALTSRSVLCMRLPHQWKIIAKHSVQFREHSVHFREHSVHLKEHSATSLPWPSDAAAPPSRSVLCVQLLHHG